MLSEKSVLNQFLNTSYKTSNDFKDYTDGSVYQNNPFFQDNEKRLEVILYQDAFEDCNPLGSAKGKHKILGIYMVLVNLKSFNRSRIDKIN